MTARGALVALYPAGERHAVEALRDRVGVAVCTSSALPGGKATFCHVLSTVIDVPGWPKVDAQSKVNIAGDAAGSPPTHASVPVVVMPAEA